MNERVYFVEVDECRAQVEWLFADVVQRLRLLLPDAIIEHVGNTSLPDGLTKGDLDVQVRVHATTFDAACDALAVVYASNPGGFTEQGRSFKDDNTHPPLGVHVTVIGGPSDIQHRQRDTLRSRPDLRAECDALKRRFHGGDMEAYREAKGRFFAHSVAP